MKRTGMTRSLDTLGRIVIPMEIRNSMGIKIGEPLEFFMNVEKGFMGIGKYSSGVSCNLCNSFQDLTYFNSLLLCKQCILDLKGNVGVSPIPAPVVKQPMYKEKKVNRSTQELVESLRRLVREHPAAKQNEYAKRLGVSQGRISQLKKLL
ncbi:AbrB/MazE/SpoVT family DNA-binding domain-containing protein [Paenibacillus brasilensis]|uniref:Transcriptional pleiotropic regulator of transition state genes n=1 Tax=Paenibacillus brasilensis TaxID=128574 RepID=A0ABU0KZM6_9BACL|nr:AbrB/MazE/SpoVT family DNA-binding domain-containing protein [Paenibacillus brasilensis]MDQ0494065.1 transcriptional pleiotropic regulator of transition state genes [Paenibacillus brasilensis]